MHSLVGLFSKLVMVIVGGTTAIVSLYAWVFPTLHIKNYSGLVIGVLGSAGLAFYYIRQARSLAIAMIGTLIIALIVFFLSMFLIVNIIGE